MKKINAGIISFFVFMVVGCASSPNVQRLDTYELCNEYQSNQATPTGERVFIGLITLGLSELDMASMEDRREEAKSEMTYRKITDCSAIGQAKYECSTILSDVESKEFQLCVLSTSNSISARMAGDNAARQAKAARAAAIMAKKASADAKAAAEAAESK